MISRRKFLGGVAALVAGGATGAWQLDQHPTALYKLGLSKSPDDTAPVSGVTVHEGAFGSAHMHQSVRYSYSIPRITPVATVFSLHGRGSNHSNTFQQLFLHDVVAELKLPLAVAAVDGGDHNYWHPRSDGTNALKMLVEEFVPLVEDKTKTDKRALFGWSMGGYGSLLAAVTYPDKFIGLAALSPALWFDAGESAAGAFDDAEDFKKHDVIALCKKRPPKRMYVACGSGDPFYNSSRRFASQTANVTSNFGDGYHDDAYWRSVAPEALRFLSDSV